MARRVFYSFHYQADSFRVQRVRQIGAIEGQRLLSSNDWEDVADGGAAAIKQWIDEEMKGKSCNVVLIGSHTAGRRWVNYEITSAWNTGKGVVGIYIHNLLDHNQKKSPKGANPFSKIPMKTSTLSLDSYVKAHDPTGAPSADVYNTIRNNIERWIEDAIADRE